MNAACLRCNGTGSLSKDLYGDLDCAHCEVATERVKLNAWIAAPPEMDAHEVSAWLIYQAGKAAALEQAAKLPTVEQVLDEIRHDLRVLSENTETFGDTCSSAASLAIEGAIDVLDDAWKAYSLAVLGLKP